MICVACSTPGSPLDRFCGECGWPMKQPSPYGGDDPTLPVARWSEAPARDGDGRALAYDAAIPETGRARIPGETAATRDKLPDFPNGRGPGGRRSGEILAGAGHNAGTFAECGEIQGAAFGAGRVVWADAHALFAWDLRSERPTRSDLGAHRPQGPEAVLVSGWRTYLATSQGWAVHHGLSGRVETLASARPSTMAATPLGAVTMVGGEVVRVTVDGGRQSLGAPPFPAVGLAADGDDLAVFGAEGAIGRWRDGTWQRVHPGVPSSELRQGWLVNGRAGALLHSGGAARAVAEPPPGLTPLEPLALEADGDVAVVPGREGWDAHRLLAFVGGSQPRVVVHAPAGTASAASRPLDTAILGSTAVFVRRDPDGRGAIAVAYIDPSGAGRLRFEPARETAVPLPNPVPTAANSLDVRLFPTPEGLVMLAHDGTRAILNLIPFP